MSKNDVIRQLVDALIWASGADAFAPGGIARQGWQLLCQPAIEAGEAELAKPDPEPVMWGSWAWDGMKNVCVPAHPPKDGKERPKLFPLYTTPPEPVITEAKS